MRRLASRFGAANVIRRDRPLTREELFRTVPSVFSEGKHESRSSDTPLFRPLLCSTTYRKKVSSRSLPVRQGFVTPRSANIPNTCCACVARG